MKFWFLIVFVFSIVASCDYFSVPKEPKAIARVGKNFLYQEDVKDVVPKGTTKKDSLAIIKSFINQWATKKLLFEAAERNLSNDKVSEFNVLMDQYKVDLYTKAYIEELVIRQVDTLVTEKQIVDYYEKNKQYFKNPSELVKLRYINLVKENPKFAKIKAKFTSFTKKDRKGLEELAVQFKSYAFNDSIWVDMNQVYQKLPFISPENKSNYLAANKSIRYEDSLDVFFVRINRMIEPNQISPYDYLKPTIKEILLNQKQQQFIKQFEKLIIQDAIKSKTYEIY